MIGKWRSLVSSTTPSTHAAWNGPAILLVPRHEDLLVVAPDGTTHVVSLEQVQAEAGRSASGRKAGERAAGDRVTESTSLTELLTQLRGGKRGRVRQAVLVLPRFQHLFRRFQVPPCDPSHLASVIRYQIDLHTNLGADEASFDFYPLDPRAEDLLSPSRRGGQLPRFEQLNANDEDLPGLNFAAEVTSVTTIEPWRVLLAKVGLSLAAVTTRSQIYVRQLVAASSVAAGDSQGDDRQVVPLHAGAGSVQPGTTMLLVRDDCGTEVLLERRGQLMAAAYVEQLPGEELEAEDLAAAIGHVRGTQAEPTVIDRVVVWGAKEPAYEAVVSRVLEAELPGTPHVACGGAHGGTAGLSESLEARLKLVARDPQQAGSLNLLRSTVVSDPTAAPRRRQVRAALAAVLTLTGAFGFADARLRDMDQQIASLANQVQASQQQLDRGDRTSKTHEAIASRWKNRQDWIPALDSVFRPMESEDAVELATLNADATRSGGESEFVLSGTAPDSTVVPRLLARYADDKSIVEVSPLGIRPQRNQDGEGVQFDLRVVRRVGQDSRE